MRILVTGGCGFIGNNLINKLKSQNHYVKTIDLKPEADYSFDISDFKNFVFHQQRMSMIHNLFSGMPRFRFNRHTDRLHLDIDWDEDLKIDDWIVAECYLITDPSSFSDVYGDMFLKKYVTALFKKQWGQNLIKFEGLQLPGGVTLNGRQLYDDANTEIERIEEEVQLKYQLPDDFMMG